MVTRLGRGVPGVDDELREVAVNVVRVEDREGARCLRGDSERWETDGPGRTPGARAAGDECRRDQEPVDVTPNAPAVVTSMPIGGSVIALARRWRHRPQDLPLASSAARPEKGAPMSGAIMQTLKIPARRGTSPTTINTTPLVVPILAAPTAMIATPATMRSPRPAALAMKEAKPFGPVDMLLLPRKLMRTGGRDDVQ